MYFIAKKENGKEKKVELDDQEHLTFMINFFKGLDKSNLTGQGITEINFFDNTFVVETLTFA